MDKGTASTSIAMPTKFVASSSNELLVVYVAADGPMSATQRCTAVTGGGLTWKLATRSNATWGTTEIWSAYSTGIFSGVITASLASSNDATLTVVAYKNAAHTVGAVGVGAAISKNPSATLTPTKSNSAIWATGHDWTTNAVIQPTSGQSIVHLFNDKRVLDSFWVQTVSGATTAGSPVTVADSVPNSDRWTMAAVEIPPA